MKIYINDKKVSRKKANELIGKERIDRYVEEAKQGFMEDPNEQQSWFLGSLGMLRIEML